VLSVWQGGVVHFVDVRKGVQRSRPLPGMRNSASGRKGFPSLSQVLLLYDACLELPVRVGKGSLSRSGGKSGGNNTRRVLGWGLGAGMGLGTEGGDGKGGTP